ncbi:Ankyrin repeats (3 copies) [Mycobacteroides salmoniphilum]|uniref:Ankyrin repeats (3 copies) n=1 Tax=Mycobacteroides salmoniphilum TaxID=404941 RepID=A0A4R8S145_9MYCO|nr:ankyrin repeat domain-containing protein [Mycobacteroides salmoniphilum]TDZ82901.1 Ankyrin repeats (3 copies) [Mycobacteroides salmoniphilum]
MVRDTPPKIDPIRPIHRAVMKNDIAALSAELAAGTDINLPGPEDMTPLHLAAYYGNVEIATLLLDEGANVDPINVWGNTPLWVGVMERRRTCPDGAIITLLLDHNADPMRTENEDRTPLMMTQIIAGFPQELAQLIEAKVAQMKDVRTEPRGQA